MMSMSASEHQPEGTHACHCSPCCGSGSSACLPTHPAVDMEAPLASPAWSLPPVYCSWSTPRRHQGKALCFPRGCPLCNTDTEMLLEMEPINEQAWNQAPGCRKLPIWHLLVLGCPRTSTSNPNMRQLRNWQMWAENRRRMQHRESSSKKALFSSLSCPVTRKSTSVQKSKSLCWNVPLFTDPKWYAPLGKSDTERCSTGIWTQLYDLFASPWVTSLPSKYVSPSLPLAGLWGWLPTLCPFQHNIGHQWNICYCGRVADNFGVELHINEEIKRTQPRVVQIRLAWFSSCMEPGQLLGTSCLFLSHLSPQ